MSDVPVRVGPSDIVLPATTVVDLTDLIEALLRAEIEQPVVGRQPS
ncbi:hypothetical protein [Cryobacterium levicorallinum]|uniref:Uncharacterized protein n=1 Tax=Cryobacterium levicorallinum TaxID=995038 RepID=A0ABY1EGU5_9MICO|nr:hypothetical protein [Cryobacterium levicorallinum]SFH80041.1 hypothetical protein SAMN05216274_11581 [Cryobacterium levicorallinum]